ncbi:MAG: WXG100 family type VII secretion target [Chloroflexi bacterium]|nr:WXG100 family type VII secretion target [Chloroflexota bacterium]MCI0649672.1 WXG100 family type VII secretion target [Chloroflexota bacterium]MCI0731222.1 WXG100 family type VII secretion target [Chloroflexota bacterium]
MAQQLIQVDCEALDHIGRRLAGQAEVMVQLQQRLRQQVERAACDWGGEAAGAFSQEVAEELLPALQQAVIEFEHGSETMAQIARLFREAEQTAQTGIDLREADGGRQWRWGGGWTGRAAGWKTHTRQFFAAGRFSRRRPNRWSG